ncbi:hypothetical protein AACH06_29950 [Ideonella sp. DXS29W]|uniref:DUF304 domain-containing protein n=1 Tax=Ideonella lacteola TaxID=2984193 RepID=A0ABU9BYS2_9BURK
MCLLVAAIGTLVFMLIQGVLGAWGPYRPVLLPERVEIGDAVIQSGSLELWLLLLVSLTVLLRELAGLRRLVFDGAQLTVTRYCTGQTLTKVRVEAIRSVSVAVPAKRRLDMSGTSKGGGYVVAVLNGADLHIPVNYVGANELVDELRKQRER